MKKLNEITIADLMPDSISGDAQVSATARAIDPQLRLISEAVDKPLILPAIDDLSEGVLEHLAVQYDVTAWDSAWPTETKRAVLKTAIADKRKMGTRGAVQRAIEAVAPIATITEWWQDTSGEMPPHTFKIDILQDGSAVDDETQASVISQVNEAKPVRSHFTFNVGQLLGGDLYFAGVLRAISYARVRSAGISIEQTRIDAGVLAALRGMNIRRLLASSHMGEMPEPVVPDSALFGGNFTTGDEISTDSVDGGQGYLPTYLVVTPLCESRGWNAGGNLNMAYFTSNGAAETQNTELDYYESYRLYDENGNAITYRAINEKYRITSAFRVNKDSSSALWDSSYLNTWLKLQQVGQMFAYTEEESGMPSDTDIYAMMYSIKPSIIVLLGLRYDGNDWLSKTFETDDFWWSGILSEEDKTLIESIGLRTSVMFYGYGGQIGSIEYNAGYSYQILGLYSDIDGTQQVQTDLSNLFVAPRVPTGDTKQYAAICNHTAITTPSMTWRVKITKN